MSRIFSKGVSLGVPLATTSGGTGRTDGTNLVPLDAWITYTPSFSGNLASGTLGTVTITGRYKVLGKTAHVAITFSVSGGNATGRPILGLPFAAANQGVGYVGCGIENATTGVSTTLDVLAGGSTGLLRNCDSSAPNLGTGARHSVTIVFEIA